MNVNSAATTVSNGSPSSFAFERVAAILQPFDGFSRFGPYGTRPPSSSSSAANGADVPESGLDANLGYAGASPLDPIQSTGGLVFPFNPTISEGINVGYESMKVIQSNESYHVYQSTENVRINLGDCVWVADTFQNARYVLATIHFLRSYSLMDFGRGRTGKPPSPMWFSAYGHYGFDRVPVLMEKADWSWPSNEEVDYVGVPEPGSDEWNSGVLRESPSSAPTANLGEVKGGFFGSLSTGGTPYTWIPRKFKVNSINLIVQHSPRYWIGFNLDDYRSGKMLQDRGGFHIEVPLQATPLQESTLAIKKPPGTTKPGPAQPQFDPESVNVDMLGNVQGGGTLYGFRK